MECFNDPDRLALISRPLLWGGLFAPGYGIRQPACPLRPLHAPGGESRVSRAQTVARGIDSFGICNKSSFFAIAIFTGLE